MTYDYLVVVAAHGDVLDELIWCFLVLRNDSGSSLVLLNKESPLASQSRMRSTEREDAIRQAARLQDLPSVKSPSFRHRIFEIPCDGIQIEKFCGSLLLLQFVQSR